MGTEVVATLLATSTETGGRTFAAMASDHNPLDHDPAVAASAAVKRP